MTTLPKEILDRIESEARNYAWRNYVSKADHPQAEFDNINTWPDDACYSYYSLLYYLNGDNPAQPVQGIFSATQLHTLQQDYERLRKALKDIVGWQGEGVPEIKKRIEYRNALKNARAALTAQPEADNQQNEQR